MSTSSRSIWETLLQVLNEFSDRPNFLHKETVLDNMAERIHLDRDAQGREVLAIWDDLFRLGIIGTGYSLQDPNPPRYHLTDRGRRTLSNLSRDPANPDGYLATLRAAGSLSAVAESYISEAVETYNRTCYKAAAVMVGCASEALILELRDVVIARLAVHGRKPAKGLLDWRAKMVLDSVAAELSLHDESMPVKLREAFHYNWPPFLQQIRAGRNDSGHPSSVAPISTETVHASLLIFPELLKLTSDLMKWITASMP
ncbi:MAG: hypothetical protein IPQ13_13285 [Holophagaceae bacterium]|nr:hypothetical protein [Holophagaceae bacterium]